MTNILPAKPFRVSKRDETKSEQRKRYINAAQICSHNSRKSKNIKPSLPKIKLPDIKEGE